MPEAGVHEVQQDQDIQFQYPHARDDDDETDRSLTYNTTSSSIRRDISALTSSALEERSTVEDEERKLLYQIRHHMATPGREWIKISAPMSGQEGYQHF